MIVPTPTPVQTEITFRIDCGEPEGSADHWGMDVGCTAKDVMDDLRTFKTRSKAIQEWQIVEDPDIYVTVDTQMSDGTWVKTEAKWTER